MIGTANFQAVEQFELAGVARPFLLRPGNEASAGPACVQLASPPGQFFANITVGEKYGLVLIVYGHVGYNRKFFIFISFYFFLFIYFFDVKYKAQ